MQRPGIILIQKAEDVPLLDSLLAAVRAVKTVAFDFLIPERLLRDPFQAKAATLRGHSGSKFIQSVGVAVDSSVWVVSLRVEFETRLQQLFASHTRKVSHSSAQNLTPVLAVRANGSTAQGLAAVLGTSSRRPRQGLHA